MSNKPNWRLAFVGGGISGALIGTATCIRTGHSLVPCLLVGACFGVAISALVTFGFYIFRHLRLP